MMGKKQKPSASAAGVAMMRAIETLKPEGSRICDDPYADALMQGGFTYALLKWMIESGLYDRMAPGAVSFVVGRERYIDDFLKICLSEGLDQVVLLGAGYDTRPYRIPGIEKTRVFEIDQAATQEDKLKRLEKVIHPLPANVTFLPVDFNTQSLGERLKSTGYNENSKTLFIWQGVTYFLTTAGVESTLAFITNHSGPGSAVVFDYFYNEILRDPHRNEVKAMQRTAHAFGEDYTFGIDHGQVEPFLSQRGFRDVKSVTMEDLKPVYFTGPNAKRTVNGSIAIATARVDKGSAAG
ncbi:MAG: SAM-dependent methyltransferase [Anaerolineales bacterium]